MNKVAGKCASSVNRNPQQEPGPPTHRHVCVRQVLVSVTVEPDHLWVPPVLDLSSEDLSHSGKVDNEGAQTSREACQMKNSRRLYDR